MKRLKIALATALCAVGIGVAAIPAQAALTRSQEGWQEVTNHCLTYQGCTNITRYYVGYYGINGSCAQYYFFFDTKYVGRKYFTTGSICSPPYAW